MMLLVVMCHRGEGKTFEYPASRGCAGRIIEDAEISSALLDPG